MMPRGDGPPNCGERSGDGRRRGFERVAGWRARERRRRRPRPETNEETRQLAARSSNDAPRRSSSTPTAEPRSPVAEGLRGRRSFRSSSRRTRRDAQTRGVERRAEAIRDRVSLAREFAAGARGDPRAQMLARARRRARRPRLRNPTGNAGSARPDRATRSRASSPAFSRRLTAR